MVWDLGQLCPKSRVVPPPSAAAAAPSPCYPTTARVSFWARACAGGWRARCRDHKGPKDVDLDHRLCSAAGCGKHASLGSPGAGACPHVRAGEECAVPSPAWAARWAL